MLGRTAQSTRASGLVAFAGGRTLTTFPQINPKTGKVFKEYTEMPEEEINQIITDASSAFQEWRKVSPSNRINIMSALADKLRNRKEEAAELMQMEMGKPVAQGIAEVEKCAYLVDWYSKNGHDFLNDTPYPTLPGFSKSYVTYQPLGVIFAIMPWNFPMWQAVRMGVPTLMAGNAVMLKHAPNCFGSALLLEDMMKEIPDLPQGLFRSIIADIPATTHIMENDLVQGMAFTGSEVAGRKIASKAGSLLKKCVIELGGSDAYAVLKDADLDLAAAAVVNARMTNGGQVCCAPKRVIVDKSVKAAFEEKVVEKVAEKKYGKDYGPLVHKKGAEDVAKQVRTSISEGAKLLIGGADIDPPTEDCGGAFFPPTVLTDVKPGMECFDHEVFGPVLAIVEAESEEEAIKLANQSHYGLGAGIFTKDTAHGEAIAKTELQAGMAFVNDSVRSDPSLPFGGVKSSGLGRECASFGMLEFVNIKTMCIK